MSELMIRIKNVTKKYKLGEIGGTTLRDELQRLNARILGKEDPTKMIGMKDYNRGETFMALDGVSFDVKKGERVGIIGHNGAGKSTLLKLISRVTAPTDGMIGLNGRVASMLEVGTGFHGELTGRENIYMNGAILGMTRAEIDRKMEDIIDFSECRQFIDTPVKRYSSGMYVKLAFSVAAHLDAEIMIMDEVLAVGDMSFQQKCLNKMRDVSRSEGRTVLYVSHNMNTIRQLCERCIVLKSGKIIYDGNTEEAISIYLGHERSLSVKNVVRDTIREPIGDSKIHINIIEIIDKDVPIIYEEEAIHIRIHYTSMENYSRLSFRVVLSTGARILVGMAATEKKIYAKKGENVLDLSVQFPNLAPGQYVGRIVFYEAEDFATEIIHDVVDDAFMIERVNKEDKRILTKKWNQQYWGGIDFPPIIVEDSIV